MLGFLEPTVQDKSMKISYSSFQFYTFLFFLPSHIAFTFIYWYHRGSISDITGKFILHFRSADRISKKHSENCFATTRSISVYPLLLPVPMWILIFKFYFYLLATINLPLYICRFSILYAFLIQFLTLALNIRHMIAEWWDKVWQKIS